MASLGLEATTADAIDAIHKYGEGGDGNMNLSQFGRMVADLRSFQVISTIRRKRWDNVLRSFLLFRGG